MQTERLHHRIDFLFTVSLFAVFLLTSVMVIAVGAGAYRHITAQSQQDDTLRTSLVYVSEKLRQSDAQGAVSIGTLDGTPALLLSQEIQDVSYTTYIYASDGFLYELFMRSDADAVPSYGTKLIPVEAFSIKQLDDTLFSVSVTAENGACASLLLHCKSQTAYPESEVAS